MFCIFGYLVTSFLGWFAIALSSLFSIEGGAVACKAAGISNFVVWVRERVHLACLYCIEDLRTECTSPWRGLSRICKRRSVCLWYQPILPSTLRCVESSWWRCPISGPFVSFIVWVAGFFENNHDGHAAQPSDAQKACVVSFEKLCGLLWRRTYDP